MITQSEKSSGVEKTGFRDTIQQFSKLSQFKESQSGAVMKGLDPQSALLRAWQSDRLARTYSDFLSNPEYSPACWFFLNEIYAPQDFSKRDQDLEYIYSLMSRFLPEFLLKLARQTIEMNILTSTLDQALLRALVEDLHIVDEITPQLYTQAYRLCDNYDERAYQIQLLVEIGRMVELATRLPLVGATLRMARFPARRAGWVEIQNFLEQGYSTFKRIHKPERFLQIIQMREMRILDKIFAGGTDPFTI